MAAMPVGTIASAVCTVSAVGTRGWGKRMRTRTCGSCWRHATMQSRCCAPGDFCCKLTWAPRLAPSATLMECFLRSEAFPTGRDGTRQALLVASSKPRSSVAGLGGAPGSLRKATGASRAEAVCRPGLESTALKSIENHGGSGPRGFGSGSYFQLLLISVAFADFHSSESMQDCVHCGEAAARNCRQGEAADSEPARCKHVTVLASLVAIVLYSFVATVLSSFPSPAPSPRRILGLTPFGLASCAGGETPQGQRQVVSLSRAAGGNAGVCAPLTAPRTSAPRPAHYRVEVESWAEASGEAHGTCNGRVSLPPMAYELTSVTVGTLHTGVQ